MQRPEDSDDRRYQLGPDPVIDMTDDPLEGIVPDLPRPIGAVGFTFDTDSSAPLFTRSSFYQPAPKIAERDDLAFHFVKLRFRRTLAGADPIKPRDEGTLRHSEFTDATWVQVLPPANRWRVRITSTGGSETVWKTSDQLGFDAKGKVVAKGMQPGATLEVLPTASDVAPDPRRRAAFKLFGLVTRRVIDAFGRTEQQALLDFRPLEDLVTPSIDLASVQLRIVEVQIRMDRQDSGEPPLPSDLPMLIAEMFPGLEQWDRDWPATRDARARIVRMSPPLGFLG